MNYLKIIRFGFCYSKCKKEIFSAKSYIRQGFPRYIRTTCISFIKLHLERENTFAYNSMVDKGYVIDLKDSKLITSVNIDNLDYYLQQEWSNKTPELLFNTFKNLGRYCSLHNICISNTMFDDFIDAFTDSIKHLSDEQLKSVFFALSEWPQTESIRTRNYIEVWTALDDECVNRMKNWSNDEMLTYESLIYLLNLTRVSDYSYKCLERFTSKYKSLTAQQLVQTLFFIGTRRKATDDMHNLEIHMNSLFPELTLDELAIMSLGFFKSKTPIRDTKLVAKIIEKIISNPNDIHEIHLAALLKTIRYSMKMSISDMVPKLLDALESRIPRLSIMCCVHIALLSTTTLAFHESSLTKTCELVLRNMDTARLKDLERLTFVMGTFNYCSQTKDAFVERLLVELRNPRRVKEIEQHGRVFACCIYYLSLLGIYPVDLVNKVLTPEFLKMAYGKQPYVYGKEILSLHNASEIFGSGSRQSCLSPKFVKILAKKYTDYVPTDEYKGNYSASDKMTLDIINVLREYRGGKEYVCGDHILPHHQKGDVILCNDINGSPVTISQFFPIKDFGLLQKPPDRNVWIILVIAGRNTIIQKSQLVTGPINLKFRELKALGYHPVIVKIYDWLSLNSSQEKCDFLNKLINKAVTE